MDIGSLYRSHHAEKSRFGYSILADERAAWFRAHTPTGGAWLDLGCRDGTLSARLADKADIFTGVDVDPSAIDEARRRFPGNDWMTMDMYQDWHELEGKKFRVIVCSEVLEHVYYPERMMQKIRAHLEPGGVFIGSVPNAFFIKHRLRYLIGTRRWTPLEDPTHITQFNYVLLHHMLEALDPTHITIEGYTKPPLSGFARRFPSVCAFDFLFAVRV
jgi:2-polyprenyl-3-methyl-5-hydroxy-6-metoxy-1,4-benzoquinol methylase